MPTDIRCLELCTWLAECQFCEIVTLLTSSLSLSLLPPPPPSSYNKQEGVIHLLLEYAEMDLNAVLKSHTATNQMPTVLYFWNQMLEVVKVRGVSLKCLGTDYHAKVGKLITSLVPRNLMINFIMEFV